MSDSTERTLGRIEGLLEGLDKGVEDLQREVREDLRGDVRRLGNEVQELRETLARSADRWDPATGMLRPQFVACPYHQPPPAVEVQVTAEAEARTGLLRQAGKFFGALAALAGAAWAYVAGSEG